MTIEKFFLTNGNYIAISSLVNLDTEHKSYVLVYYSADKTVADIRQELKEGDNFVEAVSAFCKANGLVLTADLK